MYGMEMLVGAGLGGLLIGGILAFFWGRSSSDGSQQARELERKLTELKREKKAYEEQVTGHFMETANRLNTLTANYRNVHEHLADGARTLCGESVEAKVDRLSTDTSDVSKKLIDIEPPRDYAPKNADGEPGMLNESFGIDRSDAPPAEHRDNTAEDVEEAASEQPGDSAAADTAAAGTEQPAAEPNTDGEAEDDTTASEPEVPQAEADSPESDAVADDDDTKATPNAAADNAQTGDQASDGDSAATNAAAGDDAPESTGNGEKPADEEDDKTQLSTAR